ncbi:MAG: Hsp20/alpha crystallin family protein [Candidatus Latescibacteria bacterium]|nr:Hsp20/alpha crystallin family protein [Candidatus Latescibacterota bacterium]
MNSLIPWKWGQHNAAPASVNNWFDRIWEDPFDSFLPALGSSFTSKIPSVDVSEDKKEVKVRAEIPGMTEKDIELTWHNGVLRVRGEKQDEKEEKKKNRYYKECSYGSFSRDIYLGESVDYSKAKAKYKNGVLTVTLPKTEATQKSIEVKVE